MKLEALHMGMPVKHPRYGMGTVKAIMENAAEIEFSDGRRTLEPETAGIEPGESRAQIEGLSIPLDQLLRETIEQTLTALGIGKPDQAIEQLGIRWRKGSLVLKPLDPSLQAKEIPLETFFHKIVMMRNNLRVLEQKVNGHEKLSDSEKVDFQQYITRCYGSMTTFNVLFKEKEDQF